LACSWGLNQPKSLGSCPAAGMYFRLTFKDVRLLQGRTHQHEGQDLNHDEVHHHGRVMTSWAPT
jgi:hypothetical protein